MRSPFRTLPVSLAALCIVAVWPGFAAAQGGPYPWIFDAWNRTGFNANDFHVVFIGTGGTVDDIVLTLDAVGGGSAVPNGDPGEANGIDVSWPSGSVPGADPNNRITLTFTTGWQPICVSQAWWTMNGEQVGGDLTSADYRLVPEPATAVALLAGLLLVARPRRS